MGQDFGNDYERSKNEAETMVRNADFLGPVTVYRPSIILGDSRTGRTTTYHGFYVVLRLAHTLVSRLAKGDTAGGQVVAGLGMCGHERKNFVPVDWVSAVMTHILTRPEHYGKTYHLVTQNPLPVAKLADLVQRAVETYSTLASEADASRCNADWFSRNLFNEMAVYRTYWRDDPQFDVTNTTAAAPHLPCPELDDATLLRLAKFAIDNNFGKIRVRPVQLDFDVHEHFRSSQLLPAVRSESLRRGVARAAGGRGRRRPMEARAPRRPLDRYRTGADRSLHGRLSSRFEYFPPPGCPRILRRAGGANGPGRYSGERIQAPGTGGCLGGGHHIGFENNCRPGRRSERAPRCVKITVAFRSANVAPLSRSERRTIRHLLICRYS